MKIRNLPLFLRVVLIGILSVALLNIFIHLGGWDPLLKSISLKRFDAETDSILAKALRIRPSPKFEFKHASMHGGKDVNLYVCVEVSSADLDSFLAAITFPTREGRAQDIPLVRGLPWWKIEEERIDSVIRASDRFTILVVLNYDERKRIFIFTDDGPSGFSRELWSVFKTHSR